MSARSFDINLTRKQSNILVTMPLIGMAKYSSDRNVYLHGHKVFELNDSIITLDSCGFRTASTKTAINRALAQLDLSNRITQIKGIGYMTHFNTSEKTPFYDGIKLDSFGNIIEQPKPNLTLDSPWKV